jgi:CheY-like chemotaxis protein
VDGTGGQQSGVGADKLGNLPPRPRVLLADDHARLRAALRDLLEETGFEVVGESGDGADAVAMARRVHRVLLGAAVHAVLAANAGPA